MKSEMRTNLGVALIAADEFLEDRKGKPDKFSSREEIKSFFTDCWGRLETIETAFLNQNLSFNFYFLILKTAFDAVAKVSLKLESEGFLANRVSELNLPIAKIIFDETKSVMLDVETAVQDPEYDFETDEERLETAVAAIEIRVQRVCTESFDFIQEVVENFVRVAETAAKAELKAKRKPS